MKWTDGIPYPVLHWRERLGHVEARWEAAESGRRRKDYRLTSQGQAQLAEDRRPWQAVDATLRGIGQALSASVRAGHGAARRCGASVPNLGPVPKRVRLVRTRPAWSAYTRKPLPALTAG